MPHNNRDSFIMKLLQNFRRWCFSRGTLPYWAILAYDSAAVLVSGFFVFYLQHGYLNLMQRISQVTIGMIVCLVIYMIAFFAFFALYASYKEAYCYIAEKARTVRLL